MYSYSPLDTVEQENSIVEVFLKLNHPRGESLLFVFNRNRFSHHVYFNSYLEMHVHPTAYNSVRTYIGIHYHHISP